MLALAIALLVLLAAGWAAHVMWYFYRAEQADFERTPSAPISTHPEQTGIAGLVQVQFPGPEGTVAGWYAPPRNGDAPAGAAILLLHGTNADRSGTLGETRALADGGYGVLAIDLPGQGASAGQARWGEPERRAISAALDWLERQPGVDAHRLGAVGLSMGALVLTQAAVTEPRLRALALISPPSNVTEEMLNATDRWGWLSQWPALLALHRSGMPYRDPQPLQVIGRLAPRPIFIVGGQHDTWVPPAMCRALYDAAGAPRELWIVPDGHHVDYSIVNPLAYRARLWRFFRHALGT